MTQRMRLPNRRVCESFAFQCAGLPYIASISRFPDGDLAEIFISNHKSGSDADNAARDSAVICSVALQYGAPLDVIRKALMRDSRGVASSPLGVALDLLAADSEVAQ
jgi:ribonucleoside-diphosphate reductase alpha chain